VLFVFTSQTGSAETGSEQTGPAQTGPAQNDAAQTGPAQNDAAQNVPADQEEGEPGEQQEAGDQDAGEQEVDEDDPCRFQAENTAQSKELDKKLIPLAEVRTWGPYLNAIKLALDELQNSILNEDEWADYQDFCKRTVSVINVLQNGEPIYSAKTRGYLYVMVSSYLEMKNSEFFKEDLGIDPETNLQHHYDDGRPQRVLKIKNEVETMLTFLVSEGQLQQNADGEYKLIPNGGNSIVRSFSQEFLATASNVKKALKPTLDNFSKNTIVALDEFAKFVRTIRTLKGSDGSRYVDQYTTTIIDWYDVHKCQSKRFETLMNNFDNWSKHGKKRKREFQDLARSMDHFIGAMVTVKNHVSYGVDFNQCTCERIKEKETCLEGE